MRYTKLSIVVLCVLTVVGALYGCGSSSKEGTVSGTVAGSVGDTMCRQCHSAVVDPLTGEGIIAQYDNTSPHRNSPYANNGNGCEACHGGGAQHNGVGPIPYVNPFAGNGTRCTACHAGKYQTNAPTKFAASLHGEMTIETGGACRRCHTHEGAVLGAYSGLTGSYGVMSNTSYQLAVPLQKEFGVFQCGTCHQHGGGLRVVKARDTSGNVVNWNPSKSFMANDQFNFCTSCHTMKSYDGNAVLASGNIVSYGSFTVATERVGYHNTSWYRVLATTHLNNSDNPTAGGISGYVVRIPKTADDAYASTTNPQVNPCFDCHGHEARTMTAYTNPSVTTGTRAYNPANETIWTQWAKSGHAGQLLKVKMEAVGISTGAGAVDTAMTTTVGEATAAAWFHYDWSATNRQSCQRCHTATGASNFLKNPSAYDSTKNDFQHLAGWSVSSRASKQREMLYCWGCHANVSADKGGLRNPGALSFTYTNGATAMYPDASSANVCIACHSGRETGDSIKNSTGDFSNLSFINSHYLSAGGTVFAKTGYTFDGRDYSIPASDLHDKIGMGVATGNASFDAVRNNYTSGPCVACHFGSNDGSHTLSPYTKGTTTTGVPTTDLNPVCVNCHTTRGAGTNAAIAWLGDDATAATFQGSTHKARYQAALEALRVQLAAKGYHFYEKHPYFYTSPYNTGYTELGDCTDNLPVKNWQTSGTSIFTWSGTSCTSDMGTAGTVGTGMINMGAAFSYNLLKHDPGGVAHNRRYTRRLIYDAIDQMDDGILNYSVYATLNALDAGMYVYKVSAIAYLINNGLVNGGTAAERF